jgi:hypothetical protein
MDEEVPERRKALLGFLPYMFNTYTQARSLLNPTNIAMKAINEFDDRISEQEEDLKSVLSKITDAKVTFQNGSIAVSLDRKSTLGVVESYLRKKLALVGGASCTLTPLINQYDGEFRLPNRSVFVKFLQDGADNEEQIIQSYMEKARIMSPSEVWMFGMTEKKLEMTFDPIFTELGIFRGGFKVLSLREAFAELIDKKYTVTTKSGEASAVVFLISKIQ